MTSKKEQYEKDINMIHNTMKNDYIDKIYRDWQTVINGVRHRMNSNISPEECMFIHKLIMLKKPKKVFEFGMANGMSSMIIINALNRVQGEMLMSNDPFQKKQWKSIGLHNVAQVQKVNGSSIQHKHIEKLSSDNFDDIPSEYFDMVLVDGAHDLENVIYDINNAKRILKKNGILILDDVLHDGVRDAIKVVMINDKLYKKVYVKSSKHEYNPKTMYAYIKK